MHVFVIALILLFSASGGAWADCCCCNGNEQPPSTAPDPNIWTVYDGNGTGALGPNGLPIASTEVQAGLSCTAFNRAAFLTWKNPGGDWTDANNIPQGTTPFHSTAIRAGSNMVVDIPATSLLNADGIVLRGTGGIPVTFATREHPTTAMRPRLRITLADASVQEVFPTADAGIQKTTDACNTTPTGKNITNGLGHAIIYAFPAPPANAISAVLRVTVVASWGNTTLQLFALQLPKKTLEAAGGRAAGTIKTYYYEPWEESDWWTRMGITKSLDRQWTGDRNAFYRPSQSGLFFADGGPAVLAPNTTSTMIARGTGYKGTGLLAIHNPTCLACGVELDSVNLLTLRQRMGEPAQELDEAWLTYYVKFGNDFSHAANCEGGKLPGLAGYTDKCAAAAVSGNGYCGWSLRQSYSLICDPANPAYPKVIIATYAYHGLQPGLYGQYWFGNELGLLDLNKWHCIEQRVKVNTPGVADGINEVFVNGRLAISRRDLYVRAVKPPQGFGDWRLLSQYPVSSYPQAATRPQVTDSFGRKLWLYDAGNAPTDLGIRKLYFTIHNGGVRPWGKTATEWIDEVRITDKRWGCE